MIRKKHDLRRKRHIPLSIEYRGKADSACVVCSCGYLDLIATWYTGEKLADAFGVHTAEQWQKLVDAVSAYLEAIHPR